MFGTVFCVLLAIMGLAAGGAKAAEDDIMAMRGASSDGKTHVNYFQAGWRTPHPSATDERSVAAKPLESRGDGDEYLQWKNNCLQMPPAIFGRTYELEWQNGFGRVAPYTARPSPEGAGFMELLAEELSGG